MCAKEDSAATIIQCAAMRMIALKMMSFQRIHHENNTSEQCQDEDRLLAIPDVWVTSFEITVKEPPVAFYVLSNSNKGCFFLENVALVDKEGQLLAHSGENEPEEWVRSKLDKLPTESMFKESSLIDKYHFKKEEASQLFYVDDVEVVGERISFFFNNGSRQDVYQEKKNVRVYVSDEQERTNYLHLHNWHFAFGEEVPKFCINYVEEVPDKVQKHVQNRILNQRISTTPINKTKIKKITAMKTLTFKKKMQVIESNEKAEKTLRTPLSELPPNCTPEKLKTKLPQHCAVGTVKLKLKPNENICTTPRCNKTARRKTTKKAPPTALPLLSFDM
ncbi:CTP synthase [Acrasis kona]|uniref:CTP synthase n=1 Tax=Acrasis kona TaxID=1008807 RepID=A0AAW2Z5A0_9EUKA